MVHSGVTPDVTFKELFDVQGQAGYPGLSGTGIAVQGDGVHERVTLVKALCADVRAKGGDVLLVDTCDQYRLFCEKNGGRRLSLHAVSFTLTPDRLENPFDRYRPPVAYGRLPVGDVTQGDLLHVSIGEFDSVFPERRTEAIATLLQAIEITLMSSQLPKVTFCVLDDGLLYHISSDDALRSKLTALLGQARKFGVNFVLETDTALPFEPGHDACDRLLVGCCDRSLDRLSDVSESDRLFLSQPHRDGVLPVVRGLRGQSGQRFHVHISPHERVSLIDYAGDMAFMDELQDAGLTRIAALHELARYRWQSDNHASGEAQETL